MWIVECRAIDGFRRQETSGHGWVVLISERDPADRCRKFWNKKQELAARILILIEVLYSIDDGSMTNGRWIEPIIVIRQLKSLHV